MPVGKNDNKFSFRPTRSAVNITDIQHTLMNPPPDLRQQSNYLLNNWRTPQGAGSMVQSTHYSSVSNNTNSNFSNHQTHGGEP